MINAPLGDKAALRVDGVWQQRDGFIDNATPGEPDINDRDRWLVKGQLLLEPAENITLRLIADYSKREENCCGGVLLNPRSEEHTSELQSLMRISYAVFCLKKKNKKQYRSQEPQYNGTTTE